MSLAKSKNIVFIFIALFVIISIIFFIIFLVNNPFESQNIIDVLTRTCTKYVKNIEEVLLWDGRVLIYNSTTYAEGLIRKEIVYYIGKEYVIPVANGSHVIVYVGSVGSYPLFSKGSFIHINYIAIYSRENVVKPQVIYEYFYAEEYPIPTDRRFYYPIAEENQMISLIARLPAFLPHFWIDDLVNKKTIAISNITMPSPRGISRESIEMSFIKEISIGNRTFWLVKYVFPRERSEVYVCVDAEMRLPITRMFVSDVGQKSIEYLVGITSLDQVPEELLSKLERTIYVNILTNRSIELPKPRVPISSPNTDYSA
ncbi:MAG: hypothetical protein QXT53_02640 [Ignisphaera sp.]